MAVDDLNVFPKRRGVLRVQRKACQLGARQRRSVSTHDIMTSLEHVFHSLCSIMAGLWVAHSVLYRTRATHLSNAE